MPRRTSETGSELFFVDNSDEEWKVLPYLHDWCSLSKFVDIATGYFAIGSLLALDGEWQKVDKIRILMGDEVSMRTKQAFEDGLASVTKRLEALTTLKYLVTPICSVTNCKKISTASPSGRTSLSSTKHIISETPVARAMTQTLANHVTGVCTTLLAGRRFFI